jgi:hypothetical protein
MDLAIQYIHRQLTKGLKMTKFSKDSFSGTEYVNYTTGGVSKFVARFKYVRGTKASFLTFLTKNFTVEEYFGRLEKGEAPLEIVGSKGFIQPHIKKMLKAQGYPVTRAGFEQLVQDNVAKTQQRLAA